MEKQNGKPNILGTLNALGFRPKKGLGQNFILDENILVQMAQGAEIGPEDTVLEIGPGAGTLTRVLAGAAKKLVTVEVDKTLLPVLETVLDGMANVQVLLGDIMKMDLQRLYQESLGEPFRLAANLPYYITTPILMLFLESGLPVKSMTVMVQREVADRIVARPGGKDYGVLTVMTNVWAEPRVLFSLPPEAFWPPPTVHSSVIHLPVRKEPLVAPEDLAWFRKVVRTSFGARRKQIHNNLTAGLGLNREQTEQALAACGIPSTARAETLSIEQFQALARALDAAKRQA